MRSFNRKQKNIILLCLLGLIIIVSGLVWILNSSSSTLEQDFGIKNSEDIYRIVISDRNGNSSDLERKTPDKWTVNHKYDANMVLIETIVGTIHQMQIREPLPKAARTNIIKDLASDGKIVQVYTNDYLIDFWGIKLFKRKHLKETYYVGHETSDEMGTYVLKKGDKEPYVVDIPNFRGYISSRFSPIESSWRSHVVFAYKQSEIKSIKVEVPNNPGEGYSLVSNGHGFSFHNANGEQINNFDTVKVVAFLSSFVSMNYERLAKNISQIEKDTIFSAKPQFIITINDKHGKKSSLRTYIKLNDPNAFSGGDKEYEILDINRCYAISSTMTDTLVMQFYTLDNVLKPASYFRSDNKELPMIK